MKTSAHNFAINPGEKEPTRGSFRLLEDYPHNLTVNWEALRLRRLLLKAQRGDQEAMQKLLDQFQPLRWSLGRKWRRKIDGTAWSFEDLCSEIDLAFLEAVHQYNPDKCQGKPAWWLGWKTENNLSWSYARENYLRGQLNDLRKPDAIHLDTVSGRVEPNKEANVGPRRAKGDKTREGSPERRSDEEEEEAVVYPPASRRFSETATIHGIMVRDALQELGPEDTDLLVRNLFWEIPQKQLALSRGVTQQAVSKKIARLRERLQTELPRFDGVEWPSFWPQRPWFITIRGRGIGGWPLEIAKRNRRVQEYLEECFGDQAVALPKDY